VRQSEQDAGRCLDLPSEDHTRLIELENNVRELRHANEIRRKSTGYFARAEVDRHPSTMVAFINDDQYGQL
jgi:transposase